jgi:hypothetical protein
MVKDVWLVSADIIMANGVWLVSADIIMAKDVWLVSADIVMVKDVWLVCVLFAQLRSSLRPAAHGGSSMALRSRQLCWVLPVLLVLHRHRAWRQ